MGGTESVHSGDKSGDSPGWGTFDTHFDTESNWGSDSVSGKVCELVLFLAILCGQQELLANL